MGDLLSFQLRKNTPQHARSMIAGDAEIILFPGVRYMRVEETSPLIKPPTRRAPRRREKPKNEKAS